ncbi:MAG: M28 family metallopeptidase [Pseudomonadota bacterium]|nr:M28 family metallopeptidase [Pseudomonadota bacterium]
MKVILRQTITSSSARAKPLTVAGVWRVQAGGQQLLVAPNARWPALRATLDDSAGDSTGDSTGNSTGNSADVRAVDVARGSLHGVCQKGRLFQQQYPDVPVLLNAGRYLVVDLDRATARQINAGLDDHQEPCFRLFPLNKDTVLFHRAKPNEGPETRATSLTALVNSASRSRYDQLIRQLVSWPTRHSTSASYGEAADWAEGQFAAAGLSCSRQTVSIPTGGTSSNVAAALAGVGAHPRHWLVVAHLDSVNHQGGPSAPAPGADDKASGSAAVVLMAEVLAQRQFDDDISFVLFGGEEQGLHGSRQWVAGLSSSERQRIAGVLNMDMIGSVNATPQAVLLEGAPLSQDMIDGLSTAGAQFTDLELQVSLNPFASDHVPFIDAGIPAVLTIEGADGANANIHGPGDVLATVDIDYAMKIISMNLAFVAERAGLRSSMQPPAPLPLCVCRGDERHHRGDPWRHFEAHRQALLAQYRRLQASAQWHPSLDAGWQWALATKVSA